jgi:glycosyltransferase involved in cell wall biosynthesis
MKILLMNDYAPPFGGAEIVTLDLQKALKERGHDARFFSSNVGISSGSHGADYKCLGTISRYRTLLQAANPSAFLQLRRVLAQFHPDIVHVKMFLTQLSPLILPLLRNVPSLYEIVWYRPICPLGTKMLPDRTICQNPPGLVCYTHKCLHLRDWLPLMLQMKLWKQWQKVFSQTITVSEALKRRLEAENIGPVEVISHAVPDTSQRPPLSYPPTAAFAGRLIREKGCDVLLRAFAKVIEILPEAKLLLCGDGIEKEHLIQLTKELNLFSHVSMLGQLSRKEMENRFQSCWVQVVPSVWEEPFGLVAPEAMMRGTAVVASRTGGLMEIVHHGQTGLLVPPGDAPALAEALLSLLTNRELAEKFGKAGRQRAQVSFSFTTYTDKIIECYHSLL